MIKLTKHQCNAREIVVRVDGGLTAETLGELHGMLGPEWAGRTATVDLSVVTSLDAEGREFLIELRNAGCRLVGASLYIKQLLEEA